jgi:hypothetical protein
VKPAFNMRVANKNADALLFFKISSENDYPGAKAV